MRALASQFVLATIALSGLAPIGCANPPPPPPEPAAGCNPLVGDDCLTPLPSSFFEASDGASATGVRVALPAALLPVSSRGVAVRPDPYNGKDGFSPATPFFVYFRAGVDGARLPGARDLAASVTPASPVQILDFEGGRRVPLMAELDANAGEGDRRALIIRPMAPLAPGHRFAIALIGLTDEHGAPIDLAPFRALRDRTPLSTALGPLAARTEEVFALLERSGVARASVTLAWDVHIATDATATSHLVRMRDAALAMVPSLTWSIESAVDDPAPHLAREIRATFRVPSFLEDGGARAPLHTGADGQPAIRGLGFANLLVHIPSCAKNATRPLPILVFGHGLFGDAGEINDDYHPAFLDRLCMVEIATNWIGLASDDVPVVAELIATDPNQITIVTDRLQQAHVNAQVMARLVATRLKDDPALALAGKPVTDGKEQYYFGISDGGIQGATFMALSPDAVRGVLQVAGAEWSLMMFRAYGFRSIKPILNIAFPDPLDQQLLIASMQTAFDYTDPATFAPHLLGNPLAGTPAKRILLQEAIGDAQVPNLATRVLARALGAPGIDLIEPVYGITQEEAPLDSAYTQWDVHPLPLPPAGNVPPSMDNQAHEAIRRLAMVQEQIVAFLRADGRVIQTCSGPCSF